MASTNALLVGSVQETDLCTHLSSKSFRLVASDVQTMNRDLPAFIIFLRAIVFVARATCFFHLVLICAV